MNVNTRISVALFTAIIGLLGLTGCNLDDSKYAGPQTVELINTPTPVMETSAPVEIGDDQEFIAILEANDFPFYVPKSDAEDDYIEMAQSVCDIIDSYGFDEAAARVQEIAGDSGYLTEKQGYILALASKSVYCPTA